MSRKRKKKDNVVSLYLNPEMDQIIAAAEREAEVDDGKPMWSGGQSRESWKPTGATPSFSGAPAFQGHVVGGTATTVKTYHNHYGDDVIFSADGKTVYGGKVGDVELYGFDLAIDLAGLPADALQNFVKVAPAKYKELEKLVKMPEILRLNWKDYSWPAIGLTFWKRLWALLPPKTLVCCVGGHGRTGTCAASLMVASGHWTADEAIAWVREQYCKDAIEGKGQEGYIKDLEDGFYDDTLTGESQKETQ